MHLMIRRVLSATVALAFVAAGAGRAVAAGPKGGPSGQGTVATVIELDGYENPPGVRPRANPCRANEGYTTHVSRKTGVVKNEQERVSIELSEGSVVKVEAVGDFGSSIGFSLTVDDEFEIEFIEWLTACGSDENDRILLAGSSNRYWVRVPSHTAVVPALLARIQESLEAPDVNWPSADPEHDWLYVNAAMDFRLEPVETVRYEASISNIAGSVSAWAQAVPHMVVFEPGEPNGTGVACSFAEATAPYSHELPGACSYKYVDSSAIAPYDVFIGRTTLHWNVTSSAPLAINDGESWREEAMAVAEVQAIEILGR